MHDRSASIITGQFHESQLRQAGASAARRSTGNLLLDALPDDVWERLRPNLAGMSMPAGRILHEPGATRHDAYFPCTSILTKMFLLENGVSSGVGIVGREGMVGVSLFLGSGKSRSQAQVQEAGYGFKLLGRCLREEFGRAGTLMQLLLAYTQALLEQIMQTVACNCHASLEQRLCRWLALSLDRTPSDELWLTHETVAMAIGVRRESVTEAAGRLQRLGVIRYHRGHVRILDRLALERRAGDCYYQTEAKQASPMKRSSL